METWREQNKRIKEVPLIWGNMVRHWDLICSQAWWECLWHLRECSCQDCWIQKKKKCLKHAVEVPKSRSIRFYMIHYIVVAGQKCSQLCFLFLHYMVKERGIDYKVASIFLHKLWGWVGPGAGKAQLNEWICCCNRPFQCQVIYMALSFCAFSFQNFLYVAIDIAFIVRWNLTGIGQTCKCT